VNDDRKLYEGVDDDDDDDDDEPMFGGGTQVPCSGSDLTNEAHVLNNQ